MDDQKERVPQGMKFRSALLQISRQLNDMDLEQLKFLVAGLPDKPGHAEVENAKTPIAFFMLLVKNEDISENNYYLLGHLLLEIGQKALVKRFKELMAEDTSRHSESDNSISSSSPSPSPISSSAGILNPTSPDSGIASPPHVSSQSPQSPPLMNISPQATSTPSNISHDAAVGPIFKNQPQPGSKSNQLPQVATSTSSPAQSLSFKQQKPKSSYDVSETPKSSRSHKPTGQGDSPLHEISKSMKPNPAIDNQQKRIFPKDEKYLSSQPRSQITETVSTSNDSGKSPTKGKPPELGSQDSAQSVTNPVKSNSGTHQQDQSLSSSPGSFGYNSLSSQVFGNTAINTPGKLDSFQNMLPPNSDDMGPTIQSPSVSLINPSSVDNSQNRSLPSKDAANNTQRKPSDQNFQQLMKNLKVTESTSQPAVPAAQSDDLEKDAPDEEDSMPLMHGIEQPPTANKSWTEPAHLKLVKEGNDGTILTNSKDAELFQAFPPLQRSSPTKQHGGAAVRAPPGFTSPSLQIGQGQYTPLETSAVKPSIQQFSGQDKVPQLFPNQVNPMDSQFLLQNLGHGVETGQHRRFPDGQDQPSMSDLFPNNRIQTNQSPMFNSPPEPSRSVDPFSDPKISSINTRTSDAWPDLFNSPSVPEWKAPGYIQKNAHQPKPQTYTQTHQNEAQGSMWPDSKHNQDGARHDVYSSKDDPPVRRKVQLSLNPSPYSTYSEQSSNSGNAHLSSDLDDSSTPADQKRYSSRRQQIRASNSSETNKKDLEGLKKKVSDSISKRKPKSYGKAVSKLLDEKVPKEQKTLRKYQEELAAPAKSGDNYIICAPTGSGKTLTAASICLHFHEKAKADNTCRPFKALFIVNIRHLTEQQTMAFQETLPVGTVGTIGETDLLKGVFFDAAYCVVMVTAQILVNALNKVPNPDLNLQDISMIIFDECHHTTQDHPYNEIMKRYLREKKSKLVDKRVIGKSGHWLPQIIGLSASLGVGHEKDAYRHVLTLCSNMDVRNVTQVLQHKTDLDHHVNSPEQDDIIYASPRHQMTRDLTHIIVDIMRDIESNLWDSEEIPPHASQMYEQWIVNERKTAELSSDRNQLVACLYLFEYNRALLLYEDLRAVDAYLHLEKFMEKRYVNHNLEPIEELCRELFESESTELKTISQREKDSDNPKLEKLASLLKQKFLDKPYSKGIVLTRMRLATIALVDFIKKTQILQGLPLRVKPIRLVGQGEVENFFMTESQQKEALKRFRNDDSYNLLVATDIAQEGLDMPECNFVIRYNFVSNEIGTVQSKGRARAKQSQCFLIVEGGSQNAKRELENRQKVISMQEAMDKLNQLPEIQRLADITERQDEIYKEMEAKDAVKKDRVGLHNPKLVKILCKECNANITTGNFIRKNGCHYTCTDPNIGKRVKVVKYGRPQIYRTTQNIGNIKCGNPTCGQQLGVAIYFLDDKKVISHRGYGLKVASFLFKLPPDEEKRTFKKWKKVTFDIPEMDS